MWSTINMTMQPAETNANENSQGNSEPILCFVCIDNVY